MYNIIVIIIIIIRVVISFIYIIIEWAAAYAQYACGLLFTIIFSTEGRLSLGVGQGIKHPGMPVPEGLLWGELATRQDVHLNHIMVCI